MEPIPVSVPVDISGMHSVHKRKKPIKGVLFDLYGTLFISEAGDISTSETTSGKNAFLKALKLCLPSDAKLMEGAGNNSIKDVFYNTIAEKHAEEKKKGNKTPEVEIREVWDITLRHFGIAALKKEIEEIAVVYEVIANKTWPMPDLAKTLSLVRDKGLIMGIISNAQFYSKLLFEAYLGLTASQLGFNPDLCYYSHESGIAKPGIEMFKKAASWLLREKKVSAEEVLYIGNDMLNDIKPASGAGMQTCLFAGDSRSLRLREKNRELSGIKPDYIITDLSSLKTVLNL
ncbi:MAG: HAD family hydrolase [Spirochaetia bacterium]|nr:HAD family hydrolase [Spirochaetia bacterium]